MSWEAWLQYMEREYPEQRVSYAPLTVAEVPAITQVAHAALRNVTVNAGDIRCTCPVHSGDPSATTLRINLAPGAGVGVGVWKCYSCQKGGHWNKLALHLGIDPLVVDTNPEFVQLPDLREVNSYELPNRLQPWPDDAVWERTNKDGTKTTIPAKVFRLLGAKLWCRRSQNTAGEWVQEVRAWLPIEKRPGRAEAHVAALLSSRYPGSKKYLNSAGAWPRRYLAFHTAAQKLKSIVPAADTLVLVEGPADAMRLLALGVPACPLLGVGNWTDAKADLVASCWSRALVCLDGDKAGREGQARVLGSLRQTMSAEGIELPDAQDPASVDQRTLLCALGAHGVRPYNWN